MLAGLTFAAMGWVALDYQRLLQPILHVYPRATFSLTRPMALGLVLGMSLASVNILGQTTLQQESPPDIRGRVFSVQFMLNNLIGIPPMLVLGGMADAIGIPPVMEIVGLLALLDGGRDVLIQRAPRSPVSRASIPPSRLCQDSAILSAPPPEEAS